MVSISICWVWLELKDTRTNSCVQMKVSASYPSSFEHNSCVLWNWIAGSICHVSRDDPLGSAQSMARLSLLPLANFRLLVVARCKVCKLWRYRVGHPSLGLSPHPMWYPTILSSKSHDSLVDLFMVLNAFLRSPFLQASSSKVTSLFVTLIYKGEECIF